MNAVLEILKRFWPVLLAGAGVTLELTLVGLIGGFVLGLALALGRVFGPAWLQKLSNAYVSVFRGTPLLVQLFIIYYGLPSLGLVLDQRMAAYLALGLNSAAYQAEYLRGSLQAIGDTQMMAGRAVGLSKWQTIRFVVLPQALRLVLPSWSNEPIALLKTTAVVFLIAVQDLMAQAKRAATTTYDPISSYIAAALIYLAMVLMLALIFGYLEKKARIPGMEMEKQAY